MNGLYIGVGLTLILALLVALIGPFFVDWGSYRAVFEREASRIVGYEVTVIGEVEARLLPSPRVRFGDVVVGPVAAPLARIGRFSLDLEAAPLLRGDIRISEMRFERPALALAVDGEGRFAMPARIGDRRDPSSVAVDQVEISEGRVTIADARNGGHFEIGRIAAVGSAASLAGPWRLDGGGLAGERDLAFHLAGGITADGATAIKLQVTPGDDPITLAADLVVREGGDGRAVTGRATIERRGDAAAGDLAHGLATWRVEAEIVGDTSAVEANNLTLALGPEERAAQFSGRGRITSAAEPGFDLTLSARQIELDRLVRGGSGKTAEPAALAAEAMMLAAAGGGWSPPGRLRLDIQGLVVGGGAVQDVTLDARTRPGGLAIERFEARLPGRTRIEASGRVGFDGGGRFEGRVEAAAEQPAAMAAWWRGEAVGERIDPVSATAELTVAPGHLTADDLVVEVAKAKARGHLEWDAAAGARVGLAAERLELDQVARLARLFLGREASRRPAALVLDLDAGQMAVGGVVAKGVAIGVKVAADDVTVERLEVRDLAGARLSGSGHVADPLGAPRGSLDVTVEAVKPEAPARALARLAAVDPATEERIVGFAAAAAPLNLALRLDGRSEAEATAATGSLRGFAGGAEVAADVGYAGRIDDPRRGETKLRARLAGDKATPALVRLLGGGSGGAIAAQLDVTGRPIDGVAVDLSMAVGATSTTVTGTARLPDDAAAQVEGRVKLATPDASALGALLGRPVLAFERRLPIDVSALVAGTWPQLSVGELAGRVGETTLRGSARLDVAARPMTIDGGLDLDRIDGEAVAEALLGGAVVGDGADPAQIWATVPLAGPFFDGTAVGTLAVSAGRATIGEVGLDGLRLRLTARTGEVRLEGIDAGFAGGRFGGAMTLRRSGDGATALSGRLSLARAALADVVWRRAGRAIATGSIDGDVTFTSEGRTAAALVAGLGGEGRVGLVDARVRGLAGEALVATQVALGEATPTAEKVDGLFRARMDASETELARTDIAVALQGGVARSGRQVIETPSARLTGRVALDLVHATIDADGSMEPAGEAIRATRTVISKATPTVGLAFRGPLAAPERVLDTAPLVAHLTLAGFEREIDRVETLQQDIAERARFARERRRLEEIRAAEEAARREAEAKRVMEAEAARRAQAAKAADALRPGAPAKPAEVAPAGDPRSGAKAADEPRSGVKAADEPRQGTSATEPGRAWRRAGMALRRGRAHRRFRRAGAARRRVCRRCRRRSSFRRPRRSRRRRARRRCRSFHPACRLRDGGRPGQDGASARAAARAATRSAEARLRSGVRAPSISATRAASDRPRRAARASTSAQNSGSRATEVRWPAIDIERFSIGAPRGRTGSGRPRVGRGGSSGTVGRSVRRGGTASRRRPSGRRPRPATAPLAPRGLPPDQGNGRSPGGDPGR